MKKANKIIALMLAMILSLSSLPILASASAINDETDTVEELIQPDSLGSLIEWLLKNLNNRKDDIVGTVLRLVYMFVEDIDTGSLDLMKATDEELAKVLIDYLNKNLPEWTKDLTGQSWWGLVTGAIRTVTFGSITVDLDDVDGVIKTLYSLANSNGFGDVSKLNEDALKDVSVKKSGNLGVIYALFQFLADNTDTFKKALKGNLTLGSVLGGIKIDGKKLDNTINDAVTDFISPAAIKEMLCDAIELDYETYKSYTADEIVAVAFLKLLTGAESVSQDDAKAVMNLTIYEFLDKYAGQIYKTLLVGPLNNDVKAMLVENLKPIDDDYNNILDEVFNWDYNFTGNEFDAVLAAGKGNFVAKLNDAVITLLKVILTDSAFKSLNLKTGGNENIEENLAKTFRFILPKLAKIDASKLGADLSSFTADKVKNMSSEEMAVAVLKLFFEGWFKNENMAEVNKTKTLEQLAVLAAKYAVTYNEWVPMEIKSAAKAVNVDKLDEAACLDLIFEIGMETAAKALAYNSGTTYFTLPEDTSAWTGAEYLDEIADWALNFVDGLPASADALSTERGVLDGEGGFYKINVIFDSLFDLSFISGCGNDLFAFDLETMLLDKFLGNLLNFDIAASVAMLAENETSSLFDKKINTAVIDLVDDLLTGLFEEGYTLPATYTIGDVNDDGDVTATDARLALRASVKLESLSDTASKAADVNHDNSVTAADARIILRVSVKLETLA